MCTSAGVGVVTVLSATSTCTGSDGGETSSFCTYEENVCIQTYSYIYGIAMGIHAIYHRL